VTVEVVYPDADPDAEPVADPDVTEPEAVEELEPLVTDCAGMEDVVVGCLRMHTELLRRPVVTDEAVVEVDVLDDV